MFDHLTIHIDQIKRAIRSVGEGDRSKPIIARGEKFRLLFVRRAFGLKCDAIGSKFLSVDQVASNIGNERISDKIVTQSGASINGDAGRARKITRGTSAAFDGAGDQTSHTP